MFKKLLKRVKETKPQCWLKREERMENVKDAFALKDRLRINDKLIVILVDDVLTTGNTVSEAVMILKKSGIKQVWGVAFAKD